mgnify:CR=1 FL=1
MSNEKIYPKGLITFPPRENAPDFVKGKMIITLNEFVEWAKTQSEYFKEYNGQKQLAFDIKVGDKGLYFQLDTYKGGETKTEVVKEENDLPF